MTDPQPSCSEIAKDLITKHFGQASNSNYVQFEADIEQALLSERTTAYKTCMDVVLGLACKQHPFRSVIDGGCDTNETLLDAFEAIRTEANKEIK